MTTMLMTRPLTVGELRNSLDGLPADRMVEVIGVFGSPDRLVRVDGGSLMALPDPTLPGEGATLRFLARWGW